MKRTVHVGCSLLFLFAASSVLAQGNQISQTEKVSLVNNCSKILADVKNDFKGIRKGEMYDWAGKKVYYSIVRLMPGYTSEDTYTIVYTQEQQAAIVPLHYYQEIVPFSLSALSAALVPALQAKGFVEVAPQRLHELDLVRAFRSANAVVEIRQNKNADPEEASITIGKLYYYYAKDVAALKPTVTSSKSAGANTASNKTKTGISKTATTISEKYPFEYEHPCGFKAVGAFISGDTLIEGRIMSHCTNIPYAFSSFTGTYLKNGSMWWNFKPQSGVMELKPWGALFAGDFLNGTKGPKDDPTIWAKGYIKVGGDSLYGYLHNTTNVEPKYYFTPIDKNKRRVKFYFEYNNTGKTNILYEPYTVAEEEAYWAAAEEHLRRMGTNGWQSGSGNKAISPQSKAMVAEADNARAVLYEKIGTIDRKMSQDLKDCTRDAGYGPSVVRMSGACNRVYKYCRDLSALCNEYLAKYAAYTSSNHVQDIKQRVFEAGEMLTIISR